MTKTQFIIRVAVELALMKSETAEKALPAAAVMVNEFLGDEGIQFGDPDYDWTNDGAKTLALEMGSY